MAYRTMFTNARLVYIVQKKIDPKLYTVSFEKENNSVNVTSVLSQPVLNSKDVQHGNNSGGIHKKPFVSFLTFLYSFSSILQFSRKKDI